MDKIIDRATRSSTNNVTNDDIKAYNVYGDFSIIAAESPDPVSGKTLLTMNDKDNIRNIFIKDTTYNLTFSQDGRYLLVNGDSSIIVFSVKPDLKCILYSHQSNMRSIFSQDSKLILSYSHLDGNETPFNIRDVDTNEIICDYNISIDKDHMIVDASISYDNEHIAFYVQHIEGIELKVFSMANYKNDEDPWSWNYTMKSESTNYQGSCFYCRDGTILFTSNYRSESIKVENWNPAPNIITQKYMSDFTDVKSTFSQDGNYLVYSYVHENQSCVIHTKSWKIVGKYISDLDDNSECIRKSYISSDNKCLVVILGSRVKVFKLDDIIDA